MRSIGIVLGLILAGLLIAKLDFLVFSFPLGQVIVFAVAAVIVGSWRRSSRRGGRPSSNPLEALHYE